MKIIPNQTNFKQWFKCVPQDGDLIFLTNDKCSLFKNLPFAIASKEQLKSQGSLTLWSLNSRSWYGYALNQADHCVWLPTGALENLNKDLRAQLLDEQIRLNVPTVIEHEWITSYMWSVLSDEGKAHTLQRWLIQNEVQEYESIEFDRLPDSAKVELTRIGYDKLVNQFPAYSGPNCFATTAGAIAEENKHSIFNEWMHWPTFEKYLLENGYSSVNSSTPHLGDVMIFFRDSNPIHAAYYLTEGFYFEKPGQDFYEPYRIGLFHKWKFDWPDSKLSLWRRAVGFCDANTV